MNRRQYSGNNSNTTSPDESFSNSSKTKSKTRCLKAQPQNRPASLSFDSEDSAPSMRGMQRFVGLKTMTDDQDTNLLDLGSFSKEEKTKMLFIFGAVLTHNEKFLEGLLFAKEHKDKLVPKSSISAQFATLLIDEHAYSITSKIIQHYLYHISNQGFQREGLDSIIEKIVYDALLAEKEEDVVEKEGLEEKDEVLFYTGLLQEFSTHIDERSILLISSNDAENLAESKNHEDKLFGRKSKRKTHWGGRDKIFSKIMEKIDKKISEKAFKDATRPYFERLINKIFYLLQHFLIDEVMRFDGIDGKVTAILKENYTMLEKIAADSIEAREIITFEAGDIENLARQTSQQAIAGGANLLTTQPGMAKRFTRTLPVTPRNWENVGEEEIKKAVESFTRLSARTHKGVINIVELAFQNANCGKGEQCLWFILDYLAKNSPDSPDSPDSSDQKNSLKKFLLKKNQHGQIAFDCRLKPTMRASFGTRHDMQKLTVTQKIIRRVCQRQLTLLKQQLAYCYIQQAFARLIHYLNQEVARESPSVEGKTLLESDINKLYILMQNIQKKDRLNIDILSAWIKNSNIGKSHRRRLHIGQTRRRQLLNSVDLQRLLLNIKSIHNKQDGAQIKALISEFNGGTYASTLVGFNKSVDQTETYLHKKAREAIEAANPNIFTRYRNSLDEKTLHKQLISKNAQGLIPLRYIAEMEQQLAEHSAAYQKKLIQVTSNFGKILMHLYQELARRTDDKARENILQQMSLIKETIHKITVHLLDNDRARNHSGRPEIHLDTDRRRSSSTFNPLQDNTESVVYALHLSELKNEETNKKIFNASSRRVGFFRRRAVIHDYLDELLASKQTSSACR
jgi:hypothetical protein